MIISKFNIKFDKPIYGWLYFTIKKNKKDMIKIHASSVYNPFWEYVDILFLLKYSKKRKVIIIIDQEGFEAKITFINRGRFLKIITETLSEKKDKLGKQQAFFLKKEVLKKMSDELKNSYNKNKQEFNNSHFSFMFDKIKLNKIKLN